MNATTPFVTGVILTGAVSALVVLTLDRPLRNILVELCGTRGRAAFWSALSRVVLVAVPLIFALAVQPDPDADVPVVLALATQLKWALIGVVLATVVLGMLLAGFISGSSPFPPDIAPGSGDRSRDRSSD